MVAEIGDVTRFARPEQLTSWAGLTPKHHESDTHVHRGRITKQGSRLVRWAAVESVQRAPKGSPVGMMRERIEARRGHNIAVVAAARRQVEYVFYALRDPPRPCPGQHTSGDGGMRTVAPPPTPAGRGSWGVMTPTPAGVVVPT